MHRDWIEGGPNGSAGRRSTARNERRYTNAPALLPWGPSTPSPELDAVNQRAEQTVRWAFNRAERGALYSARAQFAEALRSIAEALDLQRNTVAHTAALTAGLRALDEVNDFVPRDVRSQANMNLQLTVDAHHTPVLKNRSPKELLLLLRSACI